MNKKLIQTSITMLVIVCACIAVVMWLSNPLATSRKNFPAQLREEYEGLMSSRLEADIAKNALEATRADQERETLIELAKLEREELRNEYFRSRNINTALWFSGGFIIISSFLMLVGFVGAAIYKVITTNSETIALAVVGMKKITPEASRVHVKQLELQITLAKQLSELASSPADAQRALIGEPPIDITTYKESAPTAAQCLETGIISRNEDRFVYGFDKDTKQPKYGNLKKSNSGVAIIGVSQQGKTYDAVNIGAQHMHKGWQSIIIDLHANNKKSISNYLSAFRHKKSIIWCDSRDKVIETLDLISNELERRLQTPEKQTPLIIIADECLQLAAGYKEAFGGSILRVVTEGAKCLMFFVGISHSWKGKHHNTELRDNIFIKISHKAAAGQSNRLFQDADIANQTKDLRRGEFVLQDESMDVSRLSVPIWDENTLKSMADEAVDVPFVINGTNDRSQPIDELSKYRKIKRPLLRR